MCGYLYMYTHAHKHTHAHMNDDDWMHRSTYAYKHKTQKFTHISLHTNIHIYTHAHPTLVHTQAHTSKYSYSYTQAHTFKHTYKHTFINTYMHLQTHIYDWPTHTPIYADIPTYACSLLNLVHTYTFANIHIHACKNSHANIYIYAYMQRHVTHLCMYTYMDIYAHFFGSSIKTSKEIWSRYKNCMMTAEKQ